MSAILIEASKNLRGFRGEDISVDYDVLEAIGQGEFAVVHRCRSKKDGKEWAVKVIKKDKLETDMEVIMKELTIHSSLKPHPHIVNLKEFFVHNGLHIVLELVMGGDVFQRITKLKKYSERTASHTIREITLALQNAHSQHIVHRDLKPENLLLESSDEDAPIKLADFGLAGIIPNEGKGRLYDPCGSPGYVAPELLDSIFETDEGYGKEVDLWALGVILYLLVSGTAPFPMEIESLQVCRKGKYYFGKEFEQVSAAAKDLISKLLVRDPKKRLTADKVLEHEFITNFEELPDEHLLDTVEGLKRFNARRRFKKAMLATVAMERMAKAYRAHKEPTTQSS